MRKITNIDALKKDLSAEQIVELKHLIEYFPIPHEDQYINIEIEFGFPSEDEGA